MASQAKHCRDCYRSSILRASGCRTLLNNGSFRPILLQLLPDARAAVAIRGEILSYAPREHEEHVVLGNSNVPPEPSAALDSVETLRSHSKTLTRPHSDERLLSALANQAFLLELADATRTLSDPKAILAESAERLGRRLGVSRVAYVELTPDTKTLSHHHEWSEGLPELASVSLSYVDGATIQGLNAGKVVRVEDVRTRWDERTLTFAETRQVRAFMTVPLMKEGRQLASLSVTHHEPRRWTDTEAELAREVAERTWETLQRARAEAELRTAQANQAFLLRLADATRDELDAPMVLDITTQLVGQHLGVSRIIYSEIEPIGDAMIPRSQWSEGATPVPEAQMQDLDAKSVKQLASGEILKVNDVGHEPQLSGAAFLAANGTQAYLAIPLLKGGRHVATLTATDHRPRKWQDSEVALLSEVANRTWSTIRRARAETELEKSREALHQSEKMTALGSLLAGVSHELNNPLSVVVGQALIMEQKAPDPATSVRAAKIRSAAERCAKIVQTFLAMARQRQPERQLVDVNDLIEAAVELTGYGLRAAGVAVRLELASDLPRLLADAGQLHQLFTNLIVNAQHALESVSGPRQVRISTGVENGAVHVEVADTGPGISADIRNRIFEPFFTTKPVGSGTGLGLSFAYGVAKAHGGDLRLEDGQTGSVFTVLLPLRGQETEGRTTAANGSTTGNSGSVLVVDDELELAETLAEMLENRGWTAVIANGGRAAVECLRERDFDLVITDVRMPDVDGAQLLAWVKANRPELENRFAFLTGDTLGASAGKFLTESDRPFAHKPFSPATIEDLIRQVRERSSNNCNSRQNDK